MKHLFVRNEWKFFSVLSRADYRLAIAWWIVTVLRGVLPAGFAIVMGMLIGAIQQAENILSPLVLMGVLFVSLQILPALHQVIGANLGSQTAAWLYDQLARACVQPPGIGHLEDPKLTNDLTMARDFDLGITGPPIWISMGFIASGLVEMIAGLTSAAILFGFAWWTPLVLISAWLATHWLLRESAIWRDRNTDEVRSAQRHADYAYQLAVEPPAAKELRLFGLADWVIDRFRTQRRQLFELRWKATRLRERPVVWSLLLVLAANLIVFWALANRALTGRLELNQLITYASTAVITSMIAFGGFSWALDSAAAPVAATLRLREMMQSIGALHSGRQDTHERPTREIRFRGVTFRYPTSESAVLRELDLIIPAGTSLAIVGQNGAGKTTLAKLLCRLYDPTDGVIEVDGINLCDFDLAQWRSRITAVFQDFIRFELSLRENIAPAGANEELIQKSMIDAGAENLANLDTILGRGYEGGTELSGGQWQRVALARALCAVQTSAGVVLLDEPTAQLDIRGEAEIFERVLKATRNTTKILISHRFSTVRHADRICVLENGHVIELGTHEELMAAGGRYRTMFDLQASRFSTSGEDEQGVTYDVLT
jgi:ABC-type multidrug transport system fused ATPase/permease subunit